MAQGDTIQAKVGDLVEVTFTLDFKKAVVNQLPNKSKFSGVGFMMLCVEGAKELDGEPRDIKVTQDDQQMTAVFSFGPGGAVPDADFFKAGEKWTLKAGYCVDGGSIEPADEILLGHVQLVAP